MSSDTGLFRLHPLTKKPALREEVKNLELAVIGNCAYSAIIDQKSQIVWSCFPRFDGDPIFCSLLKRSTQTSNDIGFFDIRMSDFVKSEQQYIKNSAVLSTKLFDSHGSILEIIDFVPRFEMLEREFRPYMLIRKLSPIAGFPRAQIRIRPTFGYGWGTPEKTRGSNHVRYLLSNSTIRLTTNAPISYIVDEVVFEIAEPIYLILMPDESLKSPIIETAESFLSKTLKDWRSWIKSLTIPFEWQEQVIRAAIALKLSNFEETGAIVASMTTSIPDSEQGKNHDYRYCWLRDSFQIVSCLNGLGTVQTVENYLRFLSNVMTQLDEGSFLPPIFGVSLETRLFEKDMHRLPGYRGVSPVKLGTREAEKIQNDIFGPLILSLAQVFFDERFQFGGEQILFSKMESLGRRAIQAYKEPDYGPRGRSDLAIHTYSSVMCWAACDRLGKIASKIGETKRADYWIGEAEKIKKEIYQHCWNPEKGTFVSTWDGNNVDAFLLLLPHVLFIDVKDPRFQSTLRVIEKNLLKNGYMLLFPSNITASTAATFWYIAVLAVSERYDEARKLFENMLSTVNKMGLLSETVDVNTKELWGNFPFNAAMIGLIYCAQILSRPWRGAF